MSSTIKYSHQNNKSFVEKGVKNRIKETIIDGDKGLSFTYLKKSGDKFHRIIVKEIDNDKFEMKEKIDEKETTKDVNMSEIKKILKSNKDLDFVKDYIENLRDKVKSQKGGVIKNKIQNNDNIESLSKINNDVLDSTIKKSSKKINKSITGGAQKKSSKVMNSGVVKKASKKSSKKISKKVSKKSSKKSSKIMNGGATKKVSNKGTKKASKKVSNKGTKKASKKVSNKGTKKSSKKAY